MDAEVSIKKVTIAGKSFFVSVEHDITDRKKMEDTLKQDQNMLEALTQSIGAGFVIISKDFHIVYANNFITEFRGDSIGKLCYATLNTLDSPCSDCGVTKIFAGKKEVDSHEYCSKSLDGRTYWVEIVASPIKDKDGNIIAALEFVVDILRKNKEKLTSEKAEKNSNPYSTQTRKQLPTLTKTSASST